MDDKKKPTFLQSVVRAAVSRLQRKENPANRSILAMHSPGSAIWRPVSYAGLSEAGYKNCSTVFACVSQIAKSASRIDWYMSKKAGKRANWTEFDEHPCVDLLRKPNENEGGIRFTEKVFSYLLLAGNSYINKVQGIPSAPPSFLYSLRPDRMEVVAGAFPVAVGGYTYNAGGRPVNYKPNDILHLMEFHPLDDWYGLSRVEVASRQVDISNTSTEWNKKLLQNDMRPPGVVTAKTLNLEDIEIFKKQFVENYAGFNVAGAPLVFAGDDVKWTDISINPKDMDWLNGRRMTMREICAIFGVPSQLLGDTEASTYANYQEARKALYQETVLPLMDTYRDDLNAWLVPLYGDGLYLDYDRDAIDALQEGRAIKYSYLNAANWLMINEKRKACGFDEVDGGDVIMLPMSEVPLEQAIAEPEPVPDFTPGADDEPDPDADPDADDADVGKPNKSVKSAHRCLKAMKKSFWTVPERKAKLWQSFEMRVDTRSKSFRQLAKAYQGEQLARVQSAIAKHTGETITGMTTAELFNVKDEAAAYVKKFRGWYHDHFIRAGNAGMRAAKGELFDDGEFKTDKPKPTSWVFNMTPKQEAKLRDMVFNSGTKVNETTIDVIYGELKLAQDENLSVAKFAQDMGDKVTELSRGRINNWARTESAKVDNYGQLEGFKQTEFVEMKGWMCSFVPTSRESHMAADGQEVRVDDSFTVDGQELDYPADPAGDPENVCQCLCSIYPVVGTEE